MLLNKYQAHNKAMQSDSATCHAVDGGVKSFICNLKVWYPLVFYMGINMKKLVLLLSIILIQGCVYNSYTTKLNEPVQRKNISSYILLTDANPNDEILSATIGDELFVINRKTIGKSNTVIVKAPTGRDFPQDQVWSGTYKFNDGKYGDLYVFTTPAYYKGTIGVILDDNEQLTTNKPLVQLEGLKVGRRWPLRSATDFFAIYTDNWALRYGGMNNGEFVFEIVNKLESSTTEVLQKVQVTDKNFYNGFNIRNVLIKGISADKFGVIKYKLIDTLGPQA